MDGGLVVDTFGIDVDGLGAPWIRKHEARDGNAACGAVDAMERRVPDLFLHVDTGTIPEKVPSCFAVAIE